ECDTIQTEETIGKSNRDVDVIYIGGFWRQKLGVLARVKKALGSRGRLHGFFGIKHNLYFNAVYGAPGWVSPVSWEERVRLYQRSRIGFNIHWDDYGLGNQRLYHLPANGVLQISDCADSMNRVFEVGKEIDTYRGVDELIEKLRYYLSNEEARKKMALEG